MIFSCYNIMNITFLKIEIYLNLFFVAALYEEESEPESEFNFKLFFYILEL